MKNVSILFILSVAVFFFSATVSHVRADLQADKQALLDFVQEVPHSHSLNWNQKLSICINWTGVICSNDQSRVIGIRLSGVGLQGPMPSNTLSRLSEIQTLSLSSNALSGPFPSGFSNLKNLTYLRLESNHFSGPLPKEFSAWKNLVVANLSSNAFSGSIPPSVSNLKNLRSLDLSHNSFSGQIPDLQLPALQEINLANNNLAGIVPKSLQRFPADAFSGNNISSLHALSPAFPIQPPRLHLVKKHTELKKPAILGIVIGICVLALVVIAVLVIGCFSKKGSEDAQASQEKKPQNKIFLRKAASESQDKNNSIIFFEDCDLAFDLEDLLRASAEILGKGTYGMTYRAGLEDLTTVVVKRLREVTVGKREFEQQMDVVGRIKHDNVAALRAYYYSKDEKLIMYDYFEQGSVSAILHGDSGEGSRTPLDWDSRLRIAIGTARGIAHIHMLNGANFVHGNIKATNIFLNSQGYGCVSEIGLATLTSPIPQPALQFAGYRAPEVTDTRRSTQASDAFSYGVLLLELLTGKSPIHTTNSEEIVYLVRWVHSVVREEWTAEVFDVELLRYPNIEEEMVQMLQIAMACVDRIAEQRPEMVDVVRMVEDIRRVQTENRTSTSSTSELSTQTAVPQAIQMDLSSAPMRFHSTLGCSQ